MKTTLQRNRAHPSHHHSGANVEALEGIHNLEHFNPTTALENIWLVVA